MTHVEGVTVRWTHETERSIFTVRKVPSGDGNHSSTRHGSNQALPEYQVSYLTCTSGLTGLVPPSGPVGVLPKGPSTGTPVPSLHLIDGGLFRFSLLRLSPLSFLLSCSSRSLVDPDRPSLDSGFEPPSPPPPVFPLVFPTLLDTPNPPTSRRRGGVTGTLYDVWS